MDSKNKNLIIGVVLFLLAFIFWPSDERVEEPQAPESEVEVEELVEEESEEEPESDIVVKVDKPTLPAPPVEKLVQNVKANPVGNPNVKKQPRRYNPPPLGYVHFVVKDGWAISFGDVLLGKVKGKWNPKQMGNYEPKSVQLWPSNEIPFYINIKDSAQAKEIVDAVSEINMKTVVRLVPLEKSAQRSNYLVFTAGKENCLSYLGHIGGQQPIFLSPSCKKKEILHEIMHALGLIHEQSRTDRDKYVEVNFNNIDPKFHMQFDIIPDRLVDYYSGSAFLFDYKSIMMYDPRMFALDPNVPTFKSVTSEVISPSAGLSDSDIARVNKLYGY